MKTTADLGSISHGTLRDRDLIPSFMDALDVLWPEKAREFEEDPDLEEMWRWLEDDPEPTCEEERKTLDEAQATASWFLNETLFDTLQECAPEGCYFGSHPADGADFGFWISEDWLDDELRYGNLVVVDRETLEKWEKEGIPEDKDPKYVLVGKSKGERITECEALYTVTEGGKLNLEWSI